jgi:hypothetical protein
MPQKRSFLLSASNHRTAICPVSTATIGGGLRWDPSELQIIGQLSARFQTIHIHLNARQGDSAGFDQVKQGKLDSVRLRLIGVDNDMSAPRPGHLDHVDFLAPESWRGEIPQRLQFALEDDRRQANVIQQI